MGPFSGLLRCDCVVRRAVWMCGGLVLSCAAEPQLNTLGGNEACLRIHQTAGRLTARQPLHPCFSAAAAMESYSRAYPHLVKLHMLQEIADVAGEGGSHSRDCRSSASANGEEVCPRGCLQVTLCSACVPPQSHTLPSAGLPALPPHLAGCLQRPQGPLERQRALRWEERLRVTQSSLASQVGGCLRQLGDVSALSGFATWLDDPPCLHPILHLTPPIHPFRSLSWRCAASWPPCLALLLRPASAGCSWRSCAAALGTTRLPPPLCWKRWLPRCHGPRWSMCSCCGTRASLTGRCQRPRCWRSRRRSTAWRRPLPARRTTPASMPRLVG